MKTSDSKSTEEEIQIDAHVLELRMSNGDVFNILGLESKLQEAEKRITKMSGL